MSVHNHDEEIMKQMRRGEQHDLSKNKEDTDIGHDYNMLSRISKYELSEKHMKFVKHLMEKAPKENDNHYKLLKNFIQGLIGQAVMDYDNNYVSNRKDAKAWFPD